MKYLILAISAIICFSSCRVTRTVEKTKTIVDSSLVTENRMLKETVDELVKTVEKSSVDSTAATVEFGFKSVLYDSSSKIFDTTGLYLWAIQDRDNRTIVLPGTMGQLLRNYAPPTNKVAFYPDGRIKSAEGNIKKVSAKSAHSDSQFDSLRTVNLALSDSLSKLHSTKHTEDSATNSKTKTGWPWVWIIVGAVSGFLIRQFFPVLFLWFKSSINKLKLRS